jgi:hypothetical protein
LVCLSRLSVRSGAKLARPRWGARNGREFSFLEFVWIFFNMKTVKKTEIGCMCNSLGCTTFKINAVFKIYFKTKRGNNSHLKKKFGEDGANKK